jgi:hypothetical protein
MRHFERRLRALEDRAASAAGEPGSITLAEWVQWRTTGEQPERWLGSPAVQATVAEMQARSAAVDRMMQEYEDYE